jgi:hypothetical protein
MKTNLYNDFQKDKNKVAQALIDLGYDIDLGTGEGHYFRTPYLVNPDAKNDDYLYGSSIYLSVVLLSYSTGDRRHREEVLIPWVKCTFGVEYNKLEKYPQDEKRVRDVVKWVKENIVEKLPYKAFCDEDAYSGNFSWDKKENLGSIYFSFYVNPDFQEGYWENHTL